MAYVAIINIEAESKNKHTQHTHNIQHIIIMTTNKLRVLVTGFGPYGNTTINPSLAVVHLLQKKLGLSVDGAEIIAKEVSCEFNKSIEETTTCMEQLKPDAVIMLGEYPGRSMVTIERVAINLNDSTRYGFTDQAGVALTGTKIVEDGPDAYFSTLPLRRIVKDLRSSGIPADISGDAGTLMCNHIMYGTLHHPWARNEERPILAGFVHLPALPEIAALDENLGMPSMTAELSCQAVECIVASLVETMKNGGKDIDEPIKSRLLV